jgi:hypothetical protein
MYLSGAHAYGFPSPDSDLDLKCVHVAPTGALVGLAPSDDPARIERMDRDRRRRARLRQQRAVAGAARRAMKGNGNFLERVPRRSGARRSTSRG